MMIKIIIPEGWGKGRLDQTNEAMTLAMTTLFDPALKKEMVGRLLVEETIRKKN
ncbi:MAG: hypothetical protein UR28_C0002G0074 [Candidatus Peregrinibacteria bacterium GW2011_GWF2_33_10]|nr:MAG: hypothetical protein UR28_C0002G0074 [Candidatus Peregrinibacteria bacterium GW2011_GWF2_33_10]